MKLIDFKGKTVDKILGDGKTCLTIYFTDGSILSVNPDGRQGATMKTWTEVEKIEKKVVREIVE